MLSRFTFVCLAALALCAVTPTYAQSPTASRAQPPARPAPALAAKAAPAKAEPAARWIEVRPIPRAARTTRQVTRRTASPHPPIRGARRATKAKAMPRELSVVGGRMGNTLRKGVVISKMRMRRLMAFYLQRVQANKKSGIMLSREQEIRARSLSDMIIAPCCYTQPASIHGNAMAGAVKMSLRWLVSKGFSDSQIKLAFVNAYHPRILSVPSSKSIYVIPMLAALLALLFVGFVVLRWTRKADGSAADEDEDYEYYESEYDSEYEEQSGA